MNIPLVLDLDVYILIHYTFNKLLTRYPLLFIFWSFRKVKNYFPKLSSKVKNKISELRIIFENLVVTLRISQKLIWSSENNGTIWAVNFLILYLKSKKKTLSICVCL